MKLQNVTCYARIVIEKNIADFAIWQGSQNSNLGLRFWRPLC